MIYALIALLAVVSAAALAIPLLRRPKDDVARTDAAAALYRAQLAELDSDEERGLISPTEAEGARIEIQRRLLKESDPAAGAEASTTSSTRPLAITLVAMTLAGSAWLYLDRGHPELAWAPAPDRLDTPADQSDVDTLVLRLAQTMEERPDDIEGWLLLGRTAQAVGRFDLAARAYQEATRLDPEAAMLRVALGQSLTAEAAGLVTDPARKAFEDALALQQDQPMARYYLGLADFQARDFESSHMWWTELAREDATEAALASQLDFGLQRLSEVTGTPITPEPPRGPTQADIDAAAEMTGEERAEMIRGMVDGLAARLEDEPGDVAGWLRLARAYAVLGEPDNARQAYEGALNADPNNADALAGLSSLTPQVQE